MIIPTKLLYKKLIKNKNQRHEQKIAAKNLKIPRLQIY